MGNGQRFITPFDKKIEVQQALYEKVPYDSE